MKELSIEEKAKLYDEAIKRAKEINDEQRAQPHNVMTRVFPELAESEDEKIRKYIIKVVHEWWVRCNDPAPDFPNEEQMLTWLGKQGEQESVECTIDLSNLDQAKKDAYNDALDKIEYHSGEPTFDDGWSAAIWYLKKKNIMPQKQWKPDSSMLICLEYAIKHINKDGDKRILSKLLEQLKKL